MVTRHDFVVDDEQIILVPVKPLRALRSFVTATESVGITEERRQAKQAVAERVAEESK